MTIEKLKGLLRGCGFTQTAHNSLSVSGDQNTLLALSDILFALRATADEEGKVDAGKLEKVSKPVPEDAIRQYYTIYKTVPGGTSKWVIPDYIRVRFFDQKNLDDIIKNLRSAYPEDTILTVEIITEITDSITEYKKAAPVVEYDVYCMPKGAIDGIWIYLRTCNDLDKAVNFIDKTVNKLNHNYQIQKTVDGNVVETHEFTDTSDNKPTHNFTYEYLLSGKWNVRANQSQVGDPKTLAEAISLLHVLKMRPNYNCDQYRLRVEQLIKGLPVTYHYSKKGPK